ncbi:MAG: RecX family transcriptional regulator [Pseudomonadota bacterium]|nr:RecX family transcriptional regulator [Pseudomonadota bacterium]
MTRQSARKPRPPLDQARLDELALYYVGRFATTRAKLSDYLRRKLRERGWGGPGESADVEALVTRFARSGLVDDAAYALAKAQSLARRGYGKRRLSVALRSAGVGEGDGASAYDHAEQEQVAAALRFAERRRIGPFASAVPADPRERSKLREREVAAMVRAGHPLRLSLAILKLEPGAVPDPEDLRQDS